MHGAASQAGRLGDRPHAGVAIIGERSAGRVEDLRPVQRGVAAPATFGSVLADMIGILVLTAKWNTLTHLVPPCR